MQQVTIPLISTASMSELSPARVLKCTIRSPETGATDFVFNVTDKCQPTGTADRDVFRDIMANDMDLAIQGTKLSFKQHMINVCALHTTMKRLDIVTFADKATDVPNLRLLFLSAGLEWPLSDSVVTLDLYTIRYYAEN